MRGRLASIGVRIMYKGCHLLDKLVGVHAVGLGVVILVLTKVDVVNHCYAMRGRDILAPSSAGSRSLKAYTLFSI